MRYTVDDMGFGQVLTLERSRPSEIRGKAREWEPHGKGPSVQTAQFVRNRREEESNMPVLFILAGTALRAKFVLLNLQCELTFSVPDDPTACDQIQKALFIQLRGPTN
jgi:hypothetical protein